MSRNTWLLPFFHLGGRNVRRARLRYRRTFRSPMDAGAGTISKTAQLSPMLSKSADWDCLMDEVIRLNYWSRWMERDRGYGQRDLDKL